MIKRVLFVDDEPKILEGLQRLLRPQRNEWEIFVAEGGEAALAILERSRFDVIVSDMRMPGIDGAELLRRVRDKYPNMVRIVLSGYTELEAALRAVPVAHQFLVKPCDPSTLRVAIGRATNLYDVLNNKLVANIVGSMQELPSLPSACTDLRNALSQPSATPESVAYILEKDVALSAKVLQMVNSAFFGSLREIATVKTAVNFLGLGVIRELVQSAGVVRLLEGSEQIEGFSLEDVAFHSRLTAKIASLMPNPKGFRDAAVIAAFLHDIGKLVLAMRMPREFSRALALAKKQKRPLYEIEEEIIGVSHEEVGGYLLGLWGFPCVVIEAVANHHRAGRVPHGEIDAIVTVHLANILAHRHWQQQLNQETTAYSSIDPEYLRLMGADDKLAEWDALAESAAAELILQGAPPPGRICDASGERLAVLRMD